MADDLCLDLANMRHRLALESPSDTRDSVGGVDRSWSTFATVYGSLRPLSSRERRMAEQAELEVSHRAEIRYRSDVEHGDRISHDSRLFSIVGIRNPLERDVKLVLDLLEKDPSTAGL